MKRECWKCPKCGATDYTEVPEYDCVKGKDGYYQYYKAKCNECGTEYLNVFRELSSMTENEFNNLINNESEQINNEH